ncbi:MAG: LytTR family DNA-binding domain-containing protein [Prevotellaceae bacterium]|jgi:DNA-binding LytR/AlgR family response regulator|nr:LytTR family DNA-binding domain-containing protein [Prevotellaceae bacterium]
MAKTSSPTSIFSSRQIKCFAVDDEPLALELIQSYVNQASFLTLAGSFSNATEALEAMKRQPPELIFLDIQMPGLTGIELAAMIDAHKMKVIFTTAFDCFALEGFKVDAIDYLLKPIAYADFLKAAQKAQRYIDASSAPAAPRCITVKTGYKLHKIDLSEILYVEALRDYVAIHTASGEKIMTIASLQHIADKLPEAMFARVHRSFVVNISKIRIIERNRIVFGKTYIPISDTYKEQVKTQLNIR